MGLQKRGPGVRKIKAPLFSVPRQSNLLKKRSLLQANHFLVYQNKIISKKVFILGGANVKCSKTV